MQQIKTRLSQSLVDMDNWITECAIIKHYTRVFTGVCSNFFILNINRT